MNLEMRTLLAEARSMRLWLYNNYAMLWFSPDELETAWDNGQFRWGAMNWELRNPQEYIDLHEQTFKKAQRDLVAARMRVDQWREQQHG